MNERVNRDGRRIQSACELKMKVENREKGNEGASSKNRIRKETLRRRAPGDVA